MMKQISATAVLALGALLAAPASADDNLYVGAQAGLGKYKEFCENRAGVCDQTDYGYRVFGGYRMSKYWSFEVGWTDLGESKFTSATGGDTKFRVEGFDLVGYLMAPMTGNLSAYAKFGAYRVRTVVKSTVVGAGDASDNSSGWVGGAGLQYDLGRHIGVRAEWQRYWGVGSPATGEDDVDVY